MSKRFGLVFRIHNIHNTMTSSDLPSSESFQSVAAGNRSSGLPRWLVLGGLGLLLFAGGFLIWRFIGSRGRGGPMGMPPGVAVTLETAQSGAVQDRSEFLGSLDAQTGVALQPEVSGRIAQVFVSAGDRVAQGDAIVLISPDRTQAEVDAAAANVTAARAARDSAEASVRSLRARRLNQPAIAVAEAARSSSSASLLALQARQQELIADMALQKAEYERTVQLTEEGALSQQDLDFARRDLDVAESALAAGAREIAAAEANRDQASASLSQAEANDAGAVEEVAAAESSLQQAEATLAQAEANQAAAQENLLDRTVSAPIAGTVGDIEIKLGDYVTPSTLVTNITENATLELDLEVPIEDRDRLNTGLPVELMAPNGEDVLASGSVTFISPQTNADTQMVLTKAQFNNPQGRLQDDQRVEARIIWSEQTGVLVPTSAITRLGGQTFVYVAEDGTEEELPPPEAIPPDMPRPTQVAKLRPVQLGDIQGNRYQILSGIEPGETIVVSGILNLQDGTPILPQEAAPDQESSPAQEASPDQESSP